MALKNCHECGHQVSTTAVACPQCGAKVKKPRGCGTIFAASLILLFMVPVIVGHLSTCSSSAPQPAAPPAFDRSEYDKRAALFESKIDESYARMTSAMESGDYTQAISILRNFEKYRRTDFKKTKEYTAEIKTGDALLRLKTVPENNSELQYAIYQELVALNPTNQDFALKVQQLKDRENARIEANKLAEAKLATENAKHAAEADREKVIKGQFSSWDGSHTLLKQIILKAMNDPDSFKHVETRYGDKGDYLLVKTTYRGTNKFGGVVTDSVTAKFTISGRLIEIISDGD